MTLLKNVATVTAILDIERIAQCVETVPWLSASGAARLLAGDSTISD
jgi:hypothetical protein